MTLNISNLQLEGKNIVIVEDDIPSVNIKILNTGKQFIDYLNNDNPVIDLVFMDFLIPLVNGIECIRYFRKERKSTPAIMITAYSSEQAKTEAYIAGCNEYVLKPIYPEKIFFLIEKYLYSNIPVSLLY
jgi:CheY-like chemotaxis protein